MTAPPRLVAAERALVRALLAPQPAEAFAVEDVALRLLDAVLALGRAADAERVPPRARRRQAELAEAAQILLARRFADDLSLGAVAAELGVSVFHLCRIFRREVGVPIHRYITSLRLRAAVERLASGRVPLLDLALDLGFYSHSHFGGVFCREMGVAPSRWRDAAPLSLADRLSREPAPAAP